MMTDLIPMGEAMARIGELEAKNERLNIRLVEMTRIAVDFASDKHQKNREIERLKALFKEAADYLDKGNGTTIPEGCIFHRQFREEGDK
jgi:hypothetical protein